MTTTKNTVKIKPELVMSGDDRALFQSLPENMPDTKYTAKQKEIISRLYRNYFKHIDSIGYTPDCVDMERSEKWPSGPRMGRYHAMAICIGFVHRLKAEMDAKDMWHALNGRESYRKVIKYAYSPY